MVLRPHRSRHRPNKTVPPGHDESDFFHQFSSHPISQLPAYLRGRFLLPDYHHIHIAPLLSPLPSTRMGGEVHGCDANGGRLAIILFASCGRRWMATGVLWGGDVMLA